MLGINRMNNNIPVMMVDRAGLFLIYYKSIEKIIIVCGNKGTILFAKKTKYDMGGDLKDGKKLYLCINHEFNEESKKV